MATITRMPCRCCGRYFLFPCCGLIGKTLCLTVICPDGSVTYTPSVAPVYQSGFGDYVYETAVFHRPTFWPCQGASSTYFWFTCWKTRCDNDASPQPYPQCSDFSTVSYRLQGAIDLSADAFSCDPFYWEATWTAGGYFPAGTKFIVTEGDCPSSSGSSGSVGSSGSESGSAGSVDCTSGRCNYVLIGNAGISDDGTQYYWRYSLTDGDCPTDCPCASTIDITLPIAEEPSALLVTECGTTGGSGGTITSGGSFPPSGFPLPPGSYSSSGSGGSSGSGSGGASGPAPGSLVEG